MQSLANPRFRTNTVVWGAVLTAKCSLNVPHSKIPVLYLQVADGTSITLTGTSTLASGSMISGPNFWRSFAANLIVGPAYTYTIQKVRGSIILLAE